MGQSRQRRSVPWPMGKNIPQEPKPAREDPRAGETPKRVMPERQDPKVLQADIKHKFFGEGFLIGQEELFGGLPLGLHRIHINNEQVLRVDRKVLTLPESVIYRVKAQLFKVQKEHLEDERARLKERGKRNRPPGS